VERWLRNEQLNVRLAGDESVRRRRLAIIEFPPKRPDASEVIEHFEEKIFAEESEGVFAWMIEGAVKHWQELQQKKGFTLSADQHKRVEDLIGRSKSVETFITTQLEASGAADVTTEELDDAYCEFCIANKLGCRWLNRHAHEAQSLGCRAFAEVVR
jgi:phage/plasmid-associated DNA primase